MTVAYVEIKFTSAVNNLDFEFRANRNDYNNYKLGMVLNNYCRSHLEKKLKKGKSVLKRLLF